MDNCEFFEITKFFHFGHTLLGYVDLLLDSIVSVLKLFALIEQSAYPAGTFSVMQDLTLCWLVVNHDDAFHIRHRHNIHKCSAKREKGNSIKNLRSANESDTRTRRVRVYTSVREACLTKQTWFELVINNSNISNNKWAQNLGKLSLR